VTELVTEPAKSCVGYHITKDHSLVIISHMFISFNTKPYTQFRGNPGLAIVSGNPSLAIVSGNPSLAIILICFILSDLQFVHLSLCGH